MSISFFDIQESLRKDLIKENVELIEAEDDMPASPDEASMALKQAEFIEYVGREISDHIQDGKEFPEWMQNKLSALHEKAKDMHSTLGTHGGDDDEGMNVDEAKMTPADMNKARQVKKMYASDEPMSQTAGLRLRAAAKELERKYGKGWSRMVKEEESIEELKTGTLLRYANKAGKDALSKNIEAIRKRDMGDDAEAASLKQKSDKRYVGRQKALGKVSSRGSNKGMKEESKLWLVKMRDGSKHKKTLSSAEAENLKKKPDVISVTIIGTVQESLDEGIKHDRYMRAHGKKASGRGSWMFTTKSMGDVNYKNSKEVYQSGPNMNLSDAAKEAMKALDTKDVYVMESVEESKGFEVKYKEGMKGSVKIKKFKKESDYEKWYDKNQDNIEVLAFRDLEESAHITEKLKVSDGMSTWIKDFQASDAPQFQGKSDKERRDMAIAAYLSAKKESTNEAYKIPSNYASLIAKKKKAEMKKDNSENVDAVITKISKMKGKSAESIANSLSPVELKDITRNSAEYLKKAKEKGIKDYAEILKYAKEIQG